MNEQFPSGDTITFEENGDRVRHMWDTVDGHLFETQWVFTKKEYDLSGNDPDYTIPQDYPLMKGHREKVRGAPLYIKIKALEAERDELREKLKTLYAEDERQRQRLINTHQELKALRSERDELRERAERAEEVVLRRENALNDAIAEQDRLLERLRNTPKQSPAVSKAMSHFWNRLRDTKEAPHEPETTMSDLSKLTDARLCERLLTWDEAIMEGTEHESTLLREAARRLAALECELAEAEERKNMWIRTAKSFRERAEKAERERDLERGEKFDLRVLINGLRKYFEDPTEESLSRTEIIEMTHAEIQSLRAELDRAKAALEHIGSMSKRGEYPEIVHAPSIAREALKTENDND